MHSTYNIKLWRYVYYREDVTLQEVDTDQRNRGVMNQVLSQTVCETLRTELNIVFTVHFQMRYVQ
jgi:hypothetical protein